MGDVSPASPSNLSTGCFITYRKIYCKTWQKFYMLSEIYFRSPWFCFSYAYAAMFEKPSFLPVKFRIEFKIVLLTPKCLRGYAPIYLTNLINFPSVSARFSLHVNDDNQLV